MVSHDARKTLPDPPGMLGHIAIISEEGDVAVRVGVTLIVQYVFRAGSVTDLWISSGFRLKKHEIPG